MKSNRDIYRCRTPLVLLIIASLLTGSAGLSACQGEFAASSADAASSLEHSPLNQPAPPEQAPLGQAIPAPKGSVPKMPPSRPRYSPGELVDYVAQTGDTLPALAIRFNTSEGEIRQANPFIPTTVTTMPPGMPMKIPIYYLPLWGSSYQILPDSLFINGPATLNFHTQEFVSAHPGWLKGVVDYVSDANRSGAEIVDLVALNYSVSPRLLLALLEYQSGALTRPDLPEEIRDYPLNYRTWEYKGLYMQLVWAANLLNQAYYGYRASHLRSITHKDGRQERFDPWQNAATVALQNYFNELYDDADALRNYNWAISPDGFAATYQQLFGDPWKEDQPHLPGSLTQPEFILPFQPGYVWAYTGGPHTGWGKGEPYAALDFAPPSVAAGCIPSDMWVTAIAPGLVVRSETGIVVLDLDQDGDERTGWNIFYLHVGTDGRVPVGVTLKRGDPVGHPSCEGGTSTGTHVHVARKYNGEWMPADSIIPFNMEGWIAHNGSAAYEGTLTKNVQIVTACVCSNSKSFIQTRIK